MSRLFKNMDFLKGLILVCIVLSLGLGVWDWLLMRELDTAKRAWTTAQADTVEAYALLKEIRPLRRALEDSASLVDPGVYFQNQLITNAGLLMKDFGLQETKSGSSVQIGKNKAEERLMEVQILNRGREPNFLSRERIFKAIYHVEKNSKNWRLRTLNLRAREDIERTGKQDQGYPAELSDTWKVDRMLFASRRPAK